MSERDQYDDAIDYLTNAPECIHKAWIRAGGSHETPASCLFGFAGTVSGEWSHGWPCGCLTQIRAGIAVAATPELTAEIRADERIPADEFDITVDHLPVFAEWQRRLDREGIR